MEQTAFIYYSDPVALLAVQQDLNSDSAIIF